MRNSSCPVSLALAATLTFGPRAIAQQGTCLYVDPPFSDERGGGLYESRNGQYIPASGTVRILIVLAEVDYTTPGTDPTPAGGTSGWPAHQLPTWVNNVDPTRNLFDWNPPTGAASGLFTRYYQEASSGNFTVIADYLLAPSNGGIFRVSSATGNVTPLEAITAANAALGTSIVTGHGFSSINDFDKWTIGGQSDPTTGPGLPKLTPSTENPRKYDHVMFIWRNSMGNNGTGACYPDSSPGVLLGHDANSYSMFGAYDQAPFNIMRHEFAHLLYGGNRFHTGGGGWGYAAGQYWITQSSGWSNLGLYNCSLLSWNGWDRQRMGWKRAGQVNEVAARNAGNTAEVDGDLDAAVPGDAGTYVLRDFVATGDALRIKLPFTDPANEYPEYIWVENHQGFGRNGDPFDRFQYDQEACVADIVPGLQMYVQIDKDVRQATSSGPIYGGPADYLRPLDASGHYDDALDPTDQTTTCVCWMCPNTPFTRGLGNPLTGTGDRHFVSVDLNSDNALTLNDFKPHGMEHVGGSYQDGLYQLGSARQVFRPGGNTKVGMGTNPSSANIINSVGADVNFPNMKNLRYVYLNGVSIELLT